MISVIVPIYNAEKWLERCLLSLVEQTIFEQLEIILVNDGSEDGSLTIMQKYKDFYDNIVILNIKNGGVSNARNKGLDVAKGEFIAFVDADDYIEKDYFEYMYHHVDADVDIVCTGFIAEYTGGNTIVRKSHMDKVLNQKESVLEFLKGKDLDPNIWNKLFRKKTIEKVRFAPQYKIAEDKFFFFESLLSSNNVAILADAKYHYIVNDISAMRKDFAEKKFDSLKVMNQIENRISREYPEFLDIVSSARNDVECRIYADIFQYKAESKFPDEYRELRNSIRKFSIIKKLKTASKKHFLAYLLVRISPHLYCFMKNDMKLQYKS